MEFTMLLGAVKPKDRSDQYKILSALFILKAHKTPVTSTQVSKLLKLHFQKKVPANVPASLRAYSPYVEPVDSGPPLLWKLTANGIERLETLSGLSLVEASDAPQFNTDIGIICALAKPELSAVFQATGGENCWKELPNPRHTHVYREATFKTVKGKQLRTVATSSTSMGLTAAAIATTHLVSQYNPKIVAMIGIAAGTAGKKKEFGDVLVADPSVDYNSGKVSMEKGFREFLPDPYPLGLNARLRSVLLKYADDHPIFETIRKGWTGPLPEKPNRLHIGPLGAADQVIDDPTRILEIQLNWRKLIGVEMETYGVYRACHEAPDPKPRFVSFKAVCDFAANKKDSWQEYAAFVAATFAIAFFRTEWETLWPAEERN